MFSGLRWSKTIRGRVLLGFSGILVLNCVSGAIGYGSLQWVNQRSQLTLERAEHLRTLSFELKSNFLLARHAEEAYLDAWRGETSSTANLKKEQLEKQRSFLTLSRQNLEDIRRLQDQDPTLQTQGSDQLAMLDSLLANYSQSFEGVVTQIQLNPTDSDDRFQVVMNLVKSDLTILQNPEIQVLFWNLIAQQQAYFRTGNVLYINRIRNSINRLNSIVSQTSSVKLRRATQDYFDRLNKLLRISQQVELSRLVNEQVYQNINHILQSLLVSSQAIADRSQKNFHQAITYSTIALSITILSAFGLTIGATFWLSQLILTPLLALVQAAERVSRGDWNHTLTITGENEFAIVATAFNQMMQELRHTLNTLEDRIAERTHALEDKTCSLETALTQLQDQEDQLRHQALHDSLTTLPNRNCLNDRLNHALQALNHYPDRLFGVLFIDLNRFKVVNDSLGHWVGDQLLIEVARILQRQVDEMDTVARLGGDEFVILVESQTAVEGILRVADRVLAALKKPIYLGDRTLFTSASIGIALSHPHYPSGEMMLRDADNAMYRAKARHDSSYEIFNTEMHQQAIQRLELETDLRQSLDQNEIHVYYQPIVHARSEQLLGFEALLRWIRPQGTPIPPSVFIPLAEETGFILELGEWVLRSVCRQLVDWQLQFPIARTIQISVNVAASQFQDPTFFDRIDRLLVETQVPSHNLKLEVTESLFLDQVEIVLKTLAKLRERNIEISLDDFGTGYSSLSYLKRFPIQTLKIDKSFIDDLSQSSADVTIVESVIHIARSLGMTVVAEGVETLFQKNCLLRLGCTALQGYGIARPLSVVQAEEWLSSSPRSPQNSTIP